MNDTINRYLAILCYPFASLDFFRQDYFELILREREDKKAQKKWENRLQKSLVRHIQENYTVYSYDEIYMYLEKIYLYNLRTRGYRQVFQLYLECFQKIMHSMISQRDGKIVFKYWQNGEDENFLGGFGDMNKIFLFHSMNMHIPLDFIVMLYMSYNSENDVKCLDNYYGQIEVADHQLATVLKAGVSENHLHKGVSLSFFEIWDAFMAPINSKSTKAFLNLDIRLSDGNVKESEVLVFILAAGIVRISIAMTLKNYRDSQSGKVKELQWKQEETELRNIVKCFECGHSLEQFYQKRWNDVDEKTANREIISYFQRLWGILLQMLPELHENRTIMQELFQVPSHIHTSDENIFLFYMMRYLKEANYFSSKEPQNQTISRRILQYLRIKNYIFGRIVQKKTIRGLDYFQSEFYGKDSKLNKFQGNIIDNKSGIERQIAYWEQAMRKQFQNQNLKKIEFRASIDEKEGEFRRSIKAFLTAYRNIIREDYCRKKQGGYEVFRTFPKVGLIFHLIKQKDWGVPEKCFLDGLDDISKIQFGNLEEKYDKLIEIMRNLRDSIQGLDSYIVGIDAASLENSTPVWAFVKVYDKARDSSIEKIGYEKNGTQSLRYTFHAGEDFRHIISGLRRIDEAVTFLKFHAGDRVGHGTALGILPEKWKRWNPFVVLPRIEALENYIWAYYMLSQNPINFQSTLMAYIERRVYELAKGIYGKSQSSISLQTLVEGYLGTFNRPPVKYYEKCKEAEDVGFCKEVQNGKCSNIIWNGEKIALARHCRKFLVEMEKPINYEVTEQDIQITKTLQTILRQKLSRKGIIVEINPSSNIAIGEVDKIIDNQIYQLNRPGGEDNVMVCINSDDPTVFHTNVSNELAYVYYGMLYNNISREMALEWIDKVRKCGMKASFIQIEDSDQEVYNTLEEIINRL